MIYLKHKCFELRFIIVKAHTHTKSRVSQPKVISYYVSLNNSLEIILLHNQLKQNDEI